VIHQLQKQEGCAWKSNPEGGLGCRVAAFNWRTSGHFGEVSEHGIFHGIPKWHENKPLNIRDKIGLFTIEWE
jgi:saccharopine dehydrogenase-like NADP-dependent oxidoreductase